MVDRPPQQRSSVTSSQIATGAAASADEVTRGRILRQPSAEDLETSTITGLIRWLAENRGLFFTSYADLWQWSVREPDEFWGALWDFFRIEASRPYEAVLRGSTLQDIAWFPGAQLNFAQHLLRHEARLADGIALTCHAEDGTRSDWSWSELGCAVRQVATGLRAMGIKPGDRVVGYLPNIAASAVALLAVTAIGAVWSSCSPEFGAAAAIDRFSQIKPKLLIAISHYRYGGNDHDRRAALRELVEGVSSLEHVVLLSSDADPELAAGHCHGSTWASLMATSAPPREAFQFEVVPADHPLWIVYTSGTSGPPKAIVHSHIGALLGAMKDLTFHIEVTEQSVLFFYCTTSWIVWNVMLCGLSLGARVVLYDGSPFHPDIGQLWTIAELAGATILGTSPGFVSRLIDRGYVPIAHHPLDRLEVLVLAGAVAEASICEWLATALPSRARVISQAGSTEICGGYAGGVRLLPSRAGEIEARMLGMAVEALDPQRGPVRGEAAELVICSPFPNAPRCLWNDPTGTRLFETYLAEFSGKWRQGDIITIYADGGCRVSGRSDATIKRHGIRIGSDELYRAVAAEELVSDAIAICPQTGPFQDRLLLFVRLAGGRALDHDLERRIAGLIARRLSPRHVPDMIFEAPAVPYTATGKRMEVPLRRLFEAVIRPSQFAASLQHDPDTAAWYTTFARERQT